MAAAEEHQRSPHAVRCEPRTSHTTAAAAAMCRATGLTKNSVHQTSYTKKQHTQRTGSGARAVEQMRAQGSQCKVREDEEWRYSLHSHRLSTFTVPRSRDQEVVNIHSSIAKQPGHTRDQPSAHPRK